jgi:hypothetical protein
VAGARGGGGLRIALDEAIVSGERRDVDILALDDALTGLTELDATQCRIVELRYFAGLTDPFTQFAFTAGTSNASCVGCGPNETEYTASLLAPVLGTYSWLWRFSLDNGAHWTYCDANGAGANPASPFDAANLGTLISQ